MDLDDFSYGYECSKYEYGEYEPSDLLPKEQELMNQEI